MKWDGVLKLVPNPSDFQSFFKRRNKLEETVSKFTEPKGLETSVQQCIHTELLSSVPANQVHAQATQVQLLSQKFNGFEEGARGVSKIWMNKL